MRRRLQKAESNEYPHTLASLRVSAGGSGDSRRDDARDADGTRLQARAQTDHVHRQPAGRRQAIRRHGTRPLPRHGSHPAAEGAGRILGFARGGAQNVRCPSRRGGEVLGVQPQARGCVDVAQTKRFGDGGAVPICFDGAFSRSVQHCSGNPQRGPNSEGRACRHAGRLPESCSPESG